MEKTILLRHCFQLSSLKKQKSNMVTTKICAKKAIQFMH